MDENNNNKDTNMLDELRKSSEDVRIPDGLKPENLKYLLNKKPKKRQAKRWYYAAGTACAALCIVLLVVAVRQQGGAMAGEVDGMTTAKSEMAESQAADKKSDPAVPENAEEKNGVSKVFAEASDYEDVYRRIFEEAPKLEEEKMNSMQSSYKKDGGSALAESTEGAVEKKSEVADTAYGGSSASNHSKTNVRTEGVDEGDIVKTDGDYIYTMSRSGLLRIASAKGSELKLEGQISLDNLSDSIEEMYVDGNTLCLTATGRETSLEEGKEDTFSVAEETQTKLYTYDISDKKNIRLLGTVIQDGSYVSSRKSGDCIYLYSQYYAGRSNPVAKDQPELYIPKVNGSLIESSDILLPLIPQTDTDQLVLTSVNIKEPDKTIEQKSFVSGGGMFYVSTDNLYICELEYGDWKQEPHTKIARFSYEEGKIRGEAAGSVNGVIQDSFCLDESGGYLRIVASRSKGSFWSFRDEQSSSLYILDMDMNMTGKIDDLARGETLRSARFIGDIGYFVTYKQVDPLFSADLKDPYNPKILGELKVSGFSEYLQVYGENRLLGIGFETDPETGRQMGMKLSMFDTTDPTDVKEINKMVLGNVSHSPGLNNYKGILADEKENIIGVAMETYTPGGDASASYGVFSYDEKAGFQKLLFQGYNRWSSRGSYETLENSRGIYIGDTFYLCTDQGIASFDRTNNYKMTSSLEW